MNFGIDMINQIKQDQPELWTDTFQQRIRNKIAEAAELEKAYADELMPRGILGLNAESFEDYTRYIADRRMQAIGLNVKFGVKNPFPWMSEQVDLTKSKISLRRALPNTRPAALWNGMISRFLPA